MILETKSKKINLVYRTRSIVKVTNLLQGKNFEEVYFEALSQNNIDALSKIIFVFAEDVNSGVSAFKNSDLVYDFIDDYMAENEKSYQDIFVEIAEDINKEGFFMKKRTAEQLQEKISSPLSFNMDEIIKNSTEKAVQLVATEQFQGFLG